MTQRYASTRQLRYLAMAGKNCRTKSTTAMTVPTLMAAAMALLIPLGCANLKSHGLLESERSVALLTQPQVDLKLAIARAAEGRGDHKQALATYQELIEMDLGSADVHHRLALIYDRQGDSKQSERHYLKSLELDSTVAKVWCDFGYSMYLRESWVDSEAHFAKAIELDPQYMRARVNMGMLLARTGRYEDALHHFAVGGLQEGAAHHNVALAAALSGDTRTASSSLEKSNQADQGHTSSGDHHALEQMVERIASRK